MRRGVIAASTLLAGCSGVQTPLAPMGDQAGALHQLLVLMVAVCGFIYLLVLIGLVWALRHARQNQAAGNSASGDRNLDRGVWIAAAPARAHETGNPHLEPPAWTLDPAIILPLLTVLILFGTGWRRLRQRSRGGAARLVRQGRLFGCGWLVLTIALISPLHEAGERSPHTCSSTS